MDKNIVFLDGALVPAGIFFLKSLSPGILRGKGVFETMRSYDGKIFALKEHLSRLSGGLKSFNVTSPFSRNKIEKYLYTVLQANHLKNARLRLAVWQENQKTRIAIVAMPYPIISKAQDNKGYRVVISDIRQDRDPRFSHVKSLDYVNFLKAFNKAKSRGYDEAILLNRQGYVAEGSRSNIFFVKEGKLFTPHLRCGCLNGITRQIVMKLAKKMAMMCQEVFVSTDKLFEAEEIFLTNSLIEIMPVSFLQGHPIQKRKTGSLSFMLLDSYRKLVKKALG